MSASDNMQNTQITEGVIWKQLLIFCIPIIIGTFAFGPGAGILITIVTSVLQGTTVSAASGLYGIIMHVLATGAFVIAAGFLYKRNKSKKGAIIALIAGVVTMTCVMFFANMIVTPAFMGMPLSVIMELMPFILAFNFIKAGINATVTFFLYKRISGFLHR